MITVAVTPLFLSRLLLNPRSRQVNRELAEPYEMHRTLMCAFPKVPAGEESKAREKFNTLFRAEANDCCDRVMVYVQSTVEPNWSLLTSEDGYFLAEPDPPKDISGRYQKLQEGQIVSFRLLANPTKRIANNTKSNDPLKGKRVGLLREEEQMAWLIRKGQKREKDMPGGFEILMKEIVDLNGEVRRIPSVNVDCEGNKSGSKSEEGKGHKTIHLAVRFDGALRITDANAFRETLIQGIGSGKAFGFGLLSIAPVRSQPL